MRWIFFGIVALILAVLMRLRILPFIAWPLALPRPAPRKPAPKVPPVNAFPMVNVQKQQGQITLQGITGGEHWADEIVVDGVNAIDSTLTLVAERVLKINGTLQTVPRLRGDPTIDMTLACRDGDVIISLNALIDLGTSAAGANAIMVPGLAQGDAGTNGGHLTIIGINILQEGRIQGGTGGDGGSADADAGQPRWGTRAQSAVAVGGCGGHSGDVLFCGLETIKVLPSSLTRAGGSGQGGNATATPSHYGDGYARGGDNLVCGDVRFEAQGAGVCLVWIASTAVVTGGEVNGRIAATADVRPLGLVGAVNHTGTGGRADVVGGNGGVGGDVRFDINCRVDNQGQVRSGDGDDGGDATARAGNGWSTPARGFPGGDANAKGGAGAMAGAKPQYLDAQGQVTFAIPGNPGVGGDAESFGGTGGTANPNNPGGPSGNSDAQGGPSGNGNVAIQANKPSQPANGQDGGAALRARSEGAYR